MALEDRLVLARFVRQNRWSQDDEVDQHTSLLILRAHGLGAHLQLTPFIGERGNLGIIWRTGVANPYVRGASIGLHSEIVTDSLLQRSGCLPMTTETALEDILQCVGEAQADFEGLGQKHEVTDLFRVLRAVQVQLCHAERIREPGAAVHGQSTDTICSALKSEELHAALWELAKCLHSFLGSGDPTSGNIRAWLDRHTPFLASLMPKEDGSAKDRDAFLDRMYKIAREHPRAHLCGSRLADIHAIDRETAIVVQGAGDLTFNQRNVAFVRNHDGERIILPEGELHSQRLYRCVVSLREGNAHGRAIEALRAILSRKPDLGTLISDIHEAPSLAFLALEFLGNAPWVRLPGDVANEFHSVLRSLAPRENSSAADAFTDLIEFAISGKSVIWNGSVVPKYEVVDQFQDVRHLFDLVNLNPDHNGTFFGKRQTGDVWLLEAALLENRILAQLATQAPISVPLKDLGTDQELVTRRLVEASNYRQVHGPVRHSGEYRWVGDIHTELNIFLLPATYPCSIIGAGPFPGDETDASAGSPQNALYFMAWGHAFGRGRYAIWEDCGKVLLSLGVRYALVMDEGQDAFQLFLPNHEERHKFDDAEKSLEPIDRFFPVPLAHGDKHHLHRRRGMRATLAFYQRKRWGHEHSQSDRRRVHA
jgi:hypothetical protein